MVAGGEGVASFVQAVGGVEEIVTIGRKILAEKAGGVGGGVPGFGFHLGLKSEFEDLLMSLFVNRKEAEFFERAIRQAEFEPTAGGAQSA